MSNKTASSVFPVGAVVLIDGRERAKVCAAFPEGSTSYSFPHYKVDIVNGDQNVAVALDRVSVQPVSKTIEWKDATSYAQSDTVRKPSIWEASTKSLRICVHHYLGCDEEWFVTCQELRVQRRPLKSVDIEAAKAEAVRFLVRRAKQIVAELSALDT